MGASCLAWHVGQTCIYIATFYVLSLCLVNDHAARTADFFGLAFFIAVFESSTFTLSGYSCMKRAFKNHFFCIVRVDKRNHAAVALSGCQITWLRQALVWD